MSNECPPWCRTHRCDRCGYLVPGYGECSRKPHGMICATCRKEQAP